ncbi:MAG: twin-arginine translocase TatA/TatE family subunit [Propionibacteriaceae bacterium]|jgi:sec-independent protein translocase protein TatB|nr:twin-arginine translocase TatA/TatE family subunit [Propionibacteriaceae bacterium]
MTPLLLDIGTGEVLTLVVLGTILFGPERLPAVARKLARVIRTLRRLANSATDQIKTELGPEYAGLAADWQNQDPARAVVPTEVQSELATLRAELATLRGDVARLKTEVDRPLG